MNRRQSRDPVMRRLLAERGVFIPPLNRHRREHPKVAARADCRPDNRKFRSRKRSR